MKKRFDGVLIVSDIDGTFLGHNGRTVPKNISAIKYFTENGGRFTVASGRAHFDIRTCIHVLEELSNAPIIAANGTYLYDFSTNKAIAPIYIEPSALDGILSLIRSDFNELELLAFADEKYYTDGTHGEVANVRDRLGSELVEIAPIKEWPRQHILKLIAFGDDSTLDELALRVDALYKGLIHRSKSGKGMLELQMRGSSKGERIGVLKKHLSSDLQNITVIAAGDYENDIEMLLAADVSVCPENAIDDVKRVADFCMCHHSMGLMSDIVNGIESGKIQIH